MWLKSGLLGLGILTWTQQPAVGQQRVVPRTQLPPSVAAAISHSTARMVTTHVEPPPAHGDTAEPTHTPHDTATTVVPAGAQTVSFRRGEFLAARVAGSAKVVTKPPRPAGATPSASVDSFLALPERIVGVAANSELAFLRPAFLAEGELRYAPDIKLFQGGFSIGLEDSVNSSERRDLSGGFHFQFGGDADSLAPRALDVSHTNLPLEAVRVLARDPADSVMVRIVTAADVRGTAVWLRARPALAMGLVPQRAQGLGLERIPITVSVLGTRRTTPLAVKLSADHGTIEPDTLLLGTGMLATVYWRTEGLGPALIQAHATGADDGRAAVNFAFPFIFLVAALLGGAAGAALKSLQGSKTSLRKVLAGMGIGMLGGVVAAVVYYAIGVSLFKVDVKVPFFNEAAVFALAALAGLLGVGLAGKGQGADRGESG